MRQLKQWSPWIGGVLVVSGVVTALDGQGSPMSGWPAYFVLCALCATLILFTWRLVAYQSGPSWLVVAFTIALTARLGLGVALVHVLPHYGYDEEVQRAGYVFYDAYTRDGDAWSLASSDQMLLSAFTERSESDQYGGLIYLSALAYRTLSPDVHRPLLVVVLTATISSLAVLFTWGFVSMTFGARAAALAAWIIVLYPDAILLGASQMREPFIGTALAISLFGYGIMRKGGMRQGLLIIILSIILLALPFSPPYAIAILAAIGFAGLWEKRFSIQLSAWVLVLIVGLGIAAVVLAGLAWSNIGDLSGSGADVLLDWWRSAGGQWQRNLLAMQSDVLKGVFRVTPDWADIPLVVAYGLVRPFLPAALHDAGAPVWRMIVIWRSLGWFSLLPFLLYAPLVALRSTGLRSLPSYLSILVWVTAVLVSYRGAGDMWDNPRYRVVFLAAQAALGGWAWVHARGSGSPWLRRTGMLLGIATILFFIWYKGRSGWDRTTSLWITIGSIGLFVLLFVGGAWLFDFFRGRRTSGLTNPPPEL